MVLHVMGLDIRHEGTFLIDRPEGSGDNLFLIFKTDAVVWCKDHWADVCAGSFILYKKNSMQRYGAANKEYRNHYIHFDSMDDSFFDEIRIMTNTPAYLQNLEEIETLLRLLSRERISNSTYRGGNEDLLLQVLLRKIAENQCEKQVQRNESRHLEEMTDLRSEMYSTPGKYKNVRELAHSVNLSLSHFQALYSSYFGISCYEDLLNARINKGKDFLMHSSMQICEIAHVCGYENDTCFMRCFKKRTGVTPTEYRRSVQSFTSK